MRLPLIFGTAQYVEGLTLPGRALIRCQPDAPDGDLSTVADHTARSLELIRAIVTAIEPHVAAA